MIPWSKQKLNILMSNLFGVFMIYIVSHYVECLISSGQDVLYIYIKNQRYCTTIHLKLFHNSVCKYIMFTWSFVMQNCLLITQLATAERFWQDLVRNLDEDLKFICYAIHHFMKACFMLNTVCAIFFTYIYFHDFGLGAEIREGLIRNFSNVFITINRHKLKWKFSHGLTREISENNHAYSNENFFLPS